MTREEALEIFEHNWTCLKNYAYTDNELVEALEVATNALQQEPILDKIRVEMEETVLESLSDCGEDWFAAEKVNECLEIIDKYRQEE